MTRRRVRRPPRQVSRDTILFAAGLIGISWETFAHSGDRPTLLVLFGAMVGLPAFLRTDEHRDQTKPPDPGHPPDKTEPPESE